MCPWANLMESILQLRGKVFPGLSYSFRPHHCHHHSWQEGLNKNKWTSFFLGNFIMVASYWLVPVVLSWWHCIVVGSLHVQSHASRSISNFDFIYSPMPGSFQNWINCVTFFTFFHFLLKHFTFATSFFFRTSAKCVFELFVQNSMLLAIIVFLETKKPPALYSRGFLICSLWILSNVTFTICLKPYNSFWFVCLFLMLLRYQNKWWCYC